MARSLSPAAALTLLLSLTIAQSAAAQVSARQGTSEHLINEFESPMVLELEFPPPSTLDRKTPKSFGPKVEDFVCDDVSLLSLQFFRGKPARGERENLILVRGVVYTRPSFDRRVDLTLRLRSKEGLMGVAQLDNIDVEEKQKKKFKVLLALNRPLDELIEPTSLELIVAVRPD